MSLFGSMNTALSGLKAQARALGNISDNVANSQTIGFKRIDTTFENLVTSSGRAHETGGVTAHAEATNTVQGGVEQVDNPLALALDGRGFFSVLRPNGRGPDGVLQFDRRELYSRAGDFEPNRDGYLANSAGDVLQGWNIDANGAIDATRLGPIRAEQTAFQPVPTSNISVTANLPAGAAPGFNATSEAQVYDQLGTLRSVNLGWSRADAASPWTLSVRMPDGTLIGSTEVEFAPNGTLAGLANGAGLTTSAPNGTGGGPATVTFNRDFGAGPQEINLNLGTFAAAEGLTQYAAAGYELRSITQDGSPPGAFASIAIRDDGRVVVNYDNGQSRTVAQVPVVTFADADALERLDGQAFALTTDAGVRRLARPGELGAARLETGAVERSNVDIAAEFSKLIVAQRAYAASTRIVTTSDELLQETINLKR